MLGKNLLESGTTSQIQNQSPSYESVWLEDPDKYVPPNHREQINIDTVVGNNYEFKNLGNQIIESEIQESEEISKSRMTSNPYANFQNYIEDQDKKYGVDRTNLCTTWSVPDENIEDLKIDSLFNNSQAQYSMKKPVGDPNLPVDFNAGIKPTKICSNLNAGQENRVGQESMVIGNLEWVGTTDGKKFAVDSNETKVSD
jgi:hypothetical protein